jgi:hypothetical protein
MEQELVYGGTAWVAYDSCYHRACDTLANVDLEALDLNADAIAFATLFYAMKTAPARGRAPGTKGEERTRSATRPGSP